MDMHFLVVLIMIILAVYFLNTIDRIFIKMAGIVFLVFIVLAYYCSEKVIIHGHTVYRLFDWVTFSF